MSGPVNGFASKVAITPPRASDWTDSGSGAGERGEEGEDSDEDVPRRPGQPLFVEKDAEHDAHAGVRH
jgi:hypothetical protein